MSDFKLPLRIAEDGTKLPPSGIDPYSLPWVQGAAATVPRRIREQYAERARDLAEKLALLRSKRGKIDYLDPVYGPRRRPPSFQAMNGRPGQV